MVFKKGHNQSNNKSIKDLMEFWRIQSVINESQQQVMEATHTKVEELIELGERLERTDWALLDYIKQQEQVIQSMERRLYNAEKAIIDFFSKTPEVA